MPDAEAPATPRTTYSGIDVSHQNGVLDWPTIAQVGYSHAYIKASQGASFVDPMLVVNRALSAAEGIQRGFYHFVTWDDQADDQAANFIKAMGAINGQLPPALDVEAMPDSNGVDQWANIPMEERVLKILKIAQLVSVATGIERLVLYCSPAWLSEMLGNDPRLAIFLLWLADYTDADTVATPAPFTSLFGWQYSESGTVGPYSGVDLDRFYL